MGSGSPTCPHTRPSFSRLNTSGPSSTSHSPTSTSRRLLISSTSSPSAVAFSITISSNPAQTSTGGPSQTSRPNQPESVSLSRRAWRALDPDDRRPSEPWRTPPHPRLPGNDVGVRRPGVTIAVQTLEGNRLIRAARGHITVLDRVGLEDVADSAYGAQKPNTPASWGRHTVVPCSSMNRRYRERLF